MKRITCVGFFLFLLVCSSAFAREPEGGLLDGVEPGPDGRIDILTVFSHQDDESIYGGGAVLKAMKDPRVRLYILCMTFDQTSGAKDRLEISPDHIGRIRAEELETAAAVYGAEEVIQFMYPSRKLNTYDPEKVIGEIKDVIDRVGAEIVITHDPVGFTGHWDHVACSRLATEAFNRSGARVLYYTTLPMWLYRMLIAAAHYEFDAEPTPPDFMVDIRSVKKLKRMACYAHASQMHFTGVGWQTDLIFWKDYEHFTVAARK